MWSRLWRGKPLQRLALLWSLTKNVRAEAVSTPKKAKKSDRGSKPTAMVVQGNFAIIVKRVRQALMPEALVWNCAVRTPQKIPPKDYNALNSQILLSMPKL